MAKPKKEQMPDIKIPGIFTQAEFTRLWKAEYRHINPAEFSPTDKAAITAFSKLIQAGVIRHKKDLGLTNEVPAFCYGNTGK